LKVLEKSLNLNLKYVANLHLITTLKQMLLCISPELTFSLFAEEKETWIVNWHWIPYCFCQSVSIWASLWNQMWCIKCPRKWLTKWHSWRSSWQTSFFSRKTTNKL